MPRTRPKISILISFFENRNPESQDTLAPILFRRFVALRNSRKAINAVLTMLKGRKNLNLICLYAVIGP